MFAFLLRHAAIDLAPLRRYRDFRLLVIGQTVSMLGIEIRFVALPYQIYTLTHSSLAVGLLGLVQIIPILLLAFLGGALADAHDRRRMVILTEIAFTVLAFALIGNALLRHPFAIVVYAVAAIGAGIDAIQRPSLSALLPRLVEREDLLGASALNSMLSTAASVGGPAAAGVLIAAFGLPFAYGANVLCYGVSLVALALMRTVPPPPDAESPSVRRVLEGLRYAWSRPDLLGTYAVDMVAMFFGMPTALFPAIAQGLGGARVLGFLYSAPAAGSLLATSTSGWTKRVHRHGLAVILAAIGWGVAITLFGLTRSLPLALVCLALAGAADMVSGLFRTTIWNSTIPDALRGRLAGIEMVSYTSGPALGDLEAGTVATLFTVRLSVISGGVLCVVGTVLMAILLPEFRKYNAANAVKPDTVSAPVDATE